MCFSILMEKTPFFSPCFPYFGGKWPCPLQVSVFQAFLRPHVPGSAESRGSVGPPPGRGSSASASAGELFAPKEKETEVSGRSNLPVVVFCALFFLSFLSELQRINWKLEPRKCLEVGWVRRQIVFSARQPSAKGEFQRPLSYCFGKSTRRSVRHCGVTR